ncbi:MAG: PadR family transcriptional regulator [Gemmatimonadales bacterium]|jgi:DNA-binding PadR family transcriptional regulator
MSNPRNLSLTALSVLQAVAHGYRYGFDIMDATGIPSGTVYPALNRLERNGLLRSRWEAASVAHVEKRPPRRYYSITAAGADVLLEALALLRQLERSPGPGLGVSPRPAEG